MRRGARLIVLLGVSLLAMGAAAVWRGVRSLDEPLRVAAPLKFKVMPGASFARIAAELASRGVVGNPRAWVLYARWSGAAPAVKAGEYEIQPGATPRELLQKMVASAPSVDVRTAAGEARGALNLPAEQAKQLILEQSKTMN